MIMPLSGSVGLSGHFQFTAMCKILVNRFPNLNFLFQCFTRSGKFNWKGNIKAILRVSPDQELPVKKLRKKVRMLDVFFFKL